MTKAPKISIIIPLGPKEDRVHRLLDDLVILSDEAEIILVPCVVNTSYQQQLLKHSPLGNRIRWVPASQGRGIQMNAGAAAARHPFLWFLHADSRLTAETLTALQAALATAPDALHYFHLRFIGGDPRRMGINELGARFRSQILGLPFGDQGFCLHRDRFAEIGGFPEHALYGEDHLLVWSARQAGIRVRCIGVALQTSARKYQQKGWLASTLRNQRRLSRRTGPGDGKTGIACCDCRRYFNKRTNGSGSDDHWQWRITQSECGWCHQFSR